MARFLDKIQAERVKFNLPTKEVAVDRPGPKEGRSDGEFYRELSESELRLPRPAEVGEERVDPINPYRLTEIRSQAAIRKELGMSPLLIETRRCLTCRVWFETVGNRKCRTCNSLDASTDLSYLAGRELLYLSQSENDYIKCRDEFKSHKSWRNPK